MRDKVRSIAAHYLPDFIYLNEKNDGLAFTVTNFDNIPGGDSVAVEIAESPTMAFTYGFSEWSRHQLLAHLGTKEKWFDGVTRQVEAAELNIRRPLLDKRMFRLVKDESDDTLRLVRGMVSAQYSDMPDLDVAEALVTHMPEAWALRAHSGVSQRAFYAYVITADQVAIPGTTLRGFPGVIIRNSEVGFTSLWVVPMVWSPAHVRPLVFGTILQRRHRGTIVLSTLLEESLLKAKALWGPLFEKMRALEDVRFVDEDQAVAALRHAITIAGGSALMGHRVEAAYRARHNSQHNGGTVLEAVLTYIGAERDSDAGYDLSIVAGGVLVALTA